MRKVILLILAVIIFGYECSYGIDFPIFDLRNRIYEEGKEIKGLMPNSKDAVILLSIFDSCQIVIQQLDAYFYMLGIFETIEKDNVARSAVGYIENWLNQIKATNAISLKALNGFQDIKEEQTKSHIAKLKAFYLELNLRVDQELNKLAVIKKAMPFLRNKAKSKPTKR